MKKSGYPRICVLIESYHPIRGGMESQGRTFSAGLLARGIEHQIVTRRVTADMPARQMIGGVAVTRIGPVGTKRSGRWMMTLKVLPWLLRHRKDYDLVFVSGFRTLGTAAVLARKLTGKPCILKADSRGEMSGAFFAAGFKKHGIDPDGKIVRMIMGLRQKLLKSADGFVSLSSEMTGEFEQCGVVRHQIHQIPNAVDTSVFAPASEAEKQAIRKELNIQPETTVFIYTGRLVSYKGLPSLLEAWKRFQIDHREALLLIVGAGGMDIHNCEPMLRAYVAEHDLEQSVRFTGETDNVCRYLQASDVFVFPTLDEAFGLSLIEAMACGLAPISTTAGGIRDILQDGRNGIAVATDSTDALEKAMQCLLKDQAKRRMLASNALATVRENYALERVIDRYVQVFAPSFG